MTKPRDWIVEGDGTRCGVYARRCLRCGAVQRFNRDELDLRHFLELTREFAERHAQCAKLEDKAST